MNITTHPAQTLFASHLTAAGVRAVMDALPSNVALLNGDGIITATNDAWDAFAEAQGVDPSAVGIGVDYLSICDHAASDMCESGARFGQGLRQILIGQRRTFTQDDVLAIEHGQPRIQRSRATRLDDPNGVWILVTHEELSRPVNAAA